MKQCKDYETKKADCDCGWILKQTKSTMSRFEERKNVFLMTCESRASVTYEKQRKKESNSDYFEKFKVTVEAFEHNCGPLGSETAFIQTLVNKEDDGYPGELSRTGTSVEILK